jgi:hypothetical protein
VMIHPRKDRISHTRVRYSYISYNDLWKNIFALALTPYWQFIVLGLIRQNIEPMSVECYTQVIDIFKSLMATFNNISVIS